MTAPKISNDINSLSKNFRKKFDAWWLEVKNKYPDATVFEAKRSKERQQWLRDESNRREKLGLPRLTRTLKSNHLTGDAVDIIFYDDRRTQSYDNKPTWFGPYDDLIEMAKKYGIRNLKPKETCHFEDDGTPYNPITKEQENYIRSLMTANGKQRTSSQDKKYKKLMNDINNLCREYLGEPKK